MLNNLEDNKLNRQNQKAVPNDKAGVYYFYNRDKNLIYVGRAGDNPSFSLRHRISAHYQKDESRPGWEQELTRDAKYFLDSVHAVTNTASVETTVTMAMSLKCLMFMVHNMRGPYLLFYVFFLQ